MSSVHARQSSTDVLHPAVRHRMRAVRDALHAEGHPFEIFEAFRTPQRQADLYAQGRTAPGRIVTKAPPWSSYHQYGLACDFVLFDDGQWSWDDKGANAAAWKRLDVVGRQNGLEPLSFERPHLQLAGLDIDDLRAGRYPPGGDLAWGENVAAAIRSWPGRGAPPVPAEAFGRPAIRGAAVTPVDPVPIPADSQPESLSRPAVPQPEIRMPTPVQISTVFARIQAQVDKWEGGYVDDPRDPGGATNRGITLRTLSAWRQRPVSKDELKGLTVAETWQIMKANYYDVVCGDELPPAVAALAHNAAVLHGPKRSATFLQTVLVRAGQGIDVDGAVGRDTLAAVRAVAAGAVCDGFLREEEAYLRALARFDVYGKGWLNRLNDFRAFAGRLLQEIPQAAPVGAADAVSPGDVQRQPDLSRTVDATPHPSGTPGPTGTPLIDLTARANELIELIAGRRIAKGGAAPVPDDPADRFAMIARLVQGLAGQMIGDPKVLTPVNAAFGQMLGKLLDGRKTGIGSIGTLITVLLPQLERLIPALGGLSGVVAGAVPILQPIMIALTLWGLLGKAEKWATLPPPVPKP